MTQAPSNQADTAREMTGLFGMGIIEEVNLGDMTARVRDGELLTGWLRMGVMRALGDQMTWPYEVGEEVAYATLSGDYQSGAILCALSNGQNPANASKGVLRANAAGGYELTGDVRIDGKVTTTGDVVAGGISLQNHTHPESIGSATGKPS